MIQNSDRIEAALASLHGKAVDFEPFPVWISQPLHTLYSPADMIDDNALSTWRSMVSDSVREAGGLKCIADSIGLSPELVDSVCARVDKKLQQQPVEDLRFDFEDGFGFRSDLEEDAAASDAGRRAVVLLQSQLAPNRIGLRIKPLDTRGARRSVRTLRLFLQSFLEAAEGHEGIRQLRVTLAKVMVFAQVLAFDEICAELEQEFRLPHGSIQVEVQVEVPHLIADASAEGGLMRIAGIPRVSALHFGTYDYTSAQGVLPSEQRSTHPVAKHALRVMQAAGACHGIEVSDGSSNLLPIGDTYARRRAWRAHADQVSEAIREGVPQGWDLHPAQLPTRFLSSFALLRSEAPAALERLLAAQERNSSGRTSGVLDEPATIRMYGAVVARSLNTGAINRDELPKSLQAEDFARIARRGAI